MSFIDIHRIQIIALCEKYKVQSLSLFGSAATGEMTKESDVDLLVKFNKINPANYFLNYTAFKSSLQKLFNRKVDLLEEQTLSNPYLVNSINKSKELIYG
ncbi:MAG: nucleotidyltransferase domain-containing protein [Fluviicola sp.]|nr:nucleotidyltransferase domain-containing protein [Fluviicola sp.]